MGQVKMNVTLCNIPIQLKTTLNQVLTEWKSIFALHQSEPCAPQIVLEIFPIDQAPEQDPNVSVRMFNDGETSYSLAYSADGPSQLSIANQAVLLLPEIHCSHYYYERNGPLIVQAFVSENHILHHQIEDITLTALAPMLRRFGIYMVHAFGAGHPTQNQAILIIGPSGAGKTTTGLFLINEGWQYIGNDVVLLTTDESGTILAWPSPGNLNISPQTFQILEPLMLLNGPTSSGSFSFIDVDDLDDDDDDDDIEEADGKCHFSPAALTHHVQRPLAVTAQLFPSITLEDEVSRAERIPSGMALAQAMAQSIDNWDSATFEPHFAFLEQLTRQAQNIRTRNTANLRSLLTSLNELLSANG